MDEQMDRKIDQQTNEIDVRRRVKKGKDGKRENHFICSSLNANILS